LTCELGICDGSGWVEVDEMTARPCGCREIRARRVQSRRLGTGIPKRFRGVGFERKPIADMGATFLRPIREYARNIDRNLEEGRGFWFFGEVGTGKTSLAMLISKAALDAGHSVAIYSMPRLLADIKETYEDGSHRSYMQLFERLCSVDLLHVDDLGAEKRTEWVLEQLYAIVNERWQEKKSMTVTTNILDPEDLREQIGARTVSRLTEMCVPVALFGHDLRQPPAEVAA
jgi:DNA replication protein DnaC